MRPSASVAPLRRRVEIDPPPAPAAHPLNRASIKAAECQPLGDPLALFDAVQELGRCARLAGWTVNMAVELGREGASAMTLSLARDETAGGVEG